MTATAVVGLIPVSLAWADPSASPTRTQTTTPSTSAPTLPPTPVATAPSTTVKSAPPSSTAPPSPSTSTVRRAGLIDVGYEMECAGDDGSGWVRITGDYAAFGGQDLTWVLHGPAGVDRVGELKWWADEDWYPPLDFDLPIGHYQVVVTLADEARMVTDSEFYVAGCVGIKPACHGATFSNPAGNPAARVTLSPTGDDWVPRQDSDEDVDVILQSGESRFVEILYMEISGEAHAPADLPTSSWPNAGEYFSEIIEQHCGPTMTGGTIRCAGSGPGVVDAVVSPPNDRPARYRIIDREDDRVADSGSVGGNGRVRSELPADSYLFRSYNDENALPYDQAWFQVPPCVTSAPMCHAVRFTNKSTEAITIEYRMDQPKQAGKVRLKPGRSKTVRAEPGELSWRGIAYQTEDMWQVEPGSGSVRIRPSCTGVGPGSDDRSADRERLAATGGSPHWWLGGSGLAAMIAGLALLRRHRWDCRAADASVMCGHDVQRESGTATKL